MISLKKLAFLGILMNVIFFQGLAQEVELEPSFLRPTVKSNKKIAAISIVRLTDTLQLPFIDDFSSNALAPSDITSSDSIYNLIFQHRYLLLSTGSSFSTINFSLDTSYTITMTPTDTTFVANVPIDSIIERDYSVYPATAIDTFPIWNNYNLVDSNNTGLYDTLVVSPLANDSLSFGIVAPGSNKWTDNLAYINSSYAIDLPSIGVATLDAVNHFGFVYPQGSGAVFSADSLTSKAINLANHAPNDQLFLSFMAQKGGLGDEPENTDVLIVQFKDSSGVWNEVWNSSSESNITTSSFYNIYVAVTDVKYFYNDFQFRFVNYASLSTVSGGWKGNADQWHLDYVILDANRSVNDNYIQDVAFSELPSTKINSYFNVPWEHYKQNTGITKTSTSIRVKNHGSTSSTVNFGSSIDENGSAVFTENNSATTSVGAGSSTSFTQNYSGFTFSSSASYSTNFNIVHHLNSSTADLIKSNDTSSFKQVFGQFYAHDDGSAEAGYGINSFNGKVALKYQLLTNNDTLTAVDLYINNTLRQDNFNVPIKIIVWEDDNGYPGDTLYSGISQFPLTSDSLNSFLSYKLLTPITVSGTIYVGWEQLSAELLNIGLDKNTTLTDKAFYNVNGTWKKSSIQGAIMIHPRFGTYQFLSVADIEIKHQIYPNPFSHSIRIKNIQNATVEIYDLSGRLVRAFSEVNEEKNLSLTDLKKGSYLVKIITGNRIKSYKLIKQ